MSNLKVAELFYSIQGEGRYMGVPSVFLRTFGCNFKCGGFGMPKGELSTRPDEIALDIDNYKTYEELPIVDVGCDSYASWHPKFKHLSPKMSTDEVSEKIMDLLPNKFWEDEHLVITGGEPLLGWQRAYPDLLDHEDMLGLTEITFETNGTQEIERDFRLFLLNWSSMRAGFAGGGWHNITFSVSPKLSCSGEKFEDAIKPSVVASYEEMGYTYLKFVVANEQDAEEAHEMVKLYRAAGFYGPAYFMPLGGTEGVYNENNRKIADLAMKMGYRYSDRLQVPLFKNEWGT